MEMFSQGQEQEEIKEVPEVRWIKADTDEKLEKLKKICIKEKYIIKKQDRDGVCRIELYHKSRHRFPCKVCLFELYPYEYGFDAEKKDIYFISKCPNCRKKYIKWMFESERRAELGEETPRQKLEREIYGIVEGKWA